MIIQTEPPFQYESRRWVDEAKIPQPPPPLATERFGKIARESKKQPITQPSDIVSPEVPKKLYKARNLIQTCGAIRGAWKWEEVKKVIEAFGKTLPIFYMKKETYWDNGGNFGMAYREQEERILVPVDVAEMSDEAAASGLVHEATHAVMFRESLKASGYKSEELKSIHSQCWDVNYEHAYATETLAHYNQARWLLQCAPRLDAGTNNNYPTPTGWVYVVTGDYEAQGRISQYLEKYVDRALEYHKPKENELCGPLVMIRGDKAGQYFFSADLYLELIGPLIGARERNHLHL
ncbi:MAG: hypothetical protein PHC53_05635 [Patescibacteria group bacterium]|nr:hypothetical protein [Patescibacteria group bacterium]